MTASPATTETLDEILAAVGEDEFAEAVVDQIAQWTSDQGWDSDRYRAFAEAMHYAYSLEMI